MIFQGRLISVQLKKKSVNNLNLSKKKKNKELKPLLLLFFFFFTSIPDWLKP